ncbi:MAG: hypothetical protein JO016_17815, partial [Actinobacteria bacterium]|nr:hypothetical protein [Actinomycetota bacterium]
TVYAPDLDEPDGDGEGSGTGQAPDAASTASALVLAAERDRLARALRDTHRQLATAESQMQAMKRSATLQLGQAIVAAAKRPWIGGPRLPRHLYRMWREGRAVRSAASAQGDGFRSEDEARWARILEDAGAGAAGDRFLAAYTVPGLAWSSSARADGEDLADGLVVAGVLTDTSCAALAPDATAEQLLPHDAPFVLEGSGADLVLIEAAALLPGGAWAHAGDPAATDRGRRLADLIDLARALGKPVIFLRNAPSYLMPYLDWLGTYCDAVVDGGLGVQLARFNPIDLPAERDQTPVYAAARDERERPATKRLLDEVTGGEEAGPGSVRVIGAPTWRSAPAVYREHAVFLAATDEQAREQLACGARAVGPVTALLDGAAGRELAAAAEAGPRRLAEIKAVLHDLFETQATPVRLAELSAKVGLPPRPVPGRRVAVLAGLRDPGDAGLLADSVLSQRLRPAEVVVWLDGAQPGSAAALDPLKAEGVAVTVVTGTGLAAAARSATAPWAARWAPGTSYPPSWLLELMCALECSRADAAGQVPGADYVFTDALDPAVARTELFRDGAPPASAWGRRGLRLFAVAPTAVPTAAVTAAATSEKEQA